MVNDPGQLPDLAGEGGALVNNQVGHLSATLSIHGLQPPWALAPIIWELFHPAPSQGGEWEGLGAEGEYLKGLGAEGEDYKGLRVEVEE